MLALRDGLSQGAIKNSEFRGDVRTVEVVIESRQTNPAHVRDLLLLAVRSASDEPATFSPPDRAVDLSAVRDLDIVDVLAISATMVGGHLQALTSAATPAERQRIAGDVLATAAAMVPDVRAVNAVATVVGAAAQSDLATGAAIARCLSAFAQDELAEAAVALLASSITALASSAGVAPADVVAWSAGDGDGRSPSRQPVRVAFCGRPAAGELPLHPHAS